jgi:signal transduction histidine kinase
MDVAQFLQRYEMYTVNGERMEFGQGPLTDALDSGTVSDDVEFRLVRPDGSFGWYRGSMAPIFSNNKGVAGATVIMADITEAKSAATAMRELSQKLMRVQEDERTHLAYELHDEIGQNLTALNLNLHALQNEPGNRRLLLDSIVQVEELTGAVRNLSVELRPAMLDDLGLVAALRWYLARQRQRSGHGITFDANVTLGRLPEEITTASFRVVQEAVTNAIKHANCNAMIVRLYNEDGGLCIEVSDDGRGFDVRKETTARSFYRGPGLLSMSERVNQLGGVFEIDSEPGRGTRIMACFPIR